MTLLKAHELLTAPPDNAVLWRYMDFTKFVSMLNSSSLYFTQACQMEDKFEGVYPRATIDRAASGHGLVYPGFNPMQTLRHHSDLCRRSMYLSCWHMNPHQSAAMWQLYRKSGEGIAVRTTFARAKAAFAKTVDTIYGAVVNYIDFASDHYDDSNLFDVVTHKRMSFQHEREVRFIWWSLHAEKDEHGNLLPMNDDFNKVLPPGRAIP
jgi:hypothetical protein